MTLYERLLSATKAQDYHLERVAVETISDGERWMRSAHPDYRAIWFGKDGSEEDRRLKIEQWLWLRWLYRHEWQERGGQS